MKAIIRKDDQAVSPVIATILMVAITVVLAAVLYVMVSGLISGPGTSKPVVTLSSATVTGTQAQVSVAGASVAYSLASYKLNLVVNTSSAGTPVVLTSTGTMSITANGVTYSVTYLDISGNGQLKAGDKITVSGLRASTSYQLVLLWTSDGSQIQTQTWST